MTKNNEEITTATQKQIEAITQSTEQQITAFVDQYKGLISQQERVCKGLDDLTKLNSEMLKIEIERKEKEEQRAIEEWNEKNIPVIHIEIPDRTGLIFKDYHIKLTNTGLSIAREVVVYCNGSYVDTFSLIGNGESHTVKVPRVNIKDKQMNVEVRYRDLADNLHKKKASRKF